MEQALSKAQSQEAEIDAAQKHAQADLSRLRAGLAAAERKLEMSLQQAATTHGRGAGLAEEEKVRSEAATKLQARHRGRSTRSAMRELNIQPPKAAQAQPQALADPAIWAEVRLPAGADSRALQEAKLRRAANGAIVSLESVLSLSQLKMMSGEMARLGALEATVQSKLEATAERLRVAFPMVAWQARVLASSPWDPQSSRNVWMQRPILSNVQRPCMHGLWLPLQKKLLEPRRRPPPPLLLAARST